MRGSEWNDVIVSWLNIASNDPNVSYSDYETHVDILNSILGDNNEFELSNYSLINNSLLAIDVDDNGSTDMYVTGAVNDENWQQLLIPIHFNKSVEFIKAQILTMLACRLISLK